MRSPSFLAILSLLIISSFASAAEEIRYKIEQGKRAIARGDVDLAIDLFSQVLEAYPKDSGVYKERATAYLRKGDDDHALKDFTEAIRLNPKSFDAYLARSRIYERRNDHNKAIGDASKAISLKPLKSKKADAYWDMTERLALYRAGKPYHEKPKQPVNARPPSSSRPP